MQIISEEDFPRGGTKPSKTEKQEIPRQKNLFSSAYGGNDGKKGKKRKKSSSNEEKYDIHQELHSDFAEVLSYATIQENMLVLGNIRNVKGLSMSIELPGRCYGNLSISCISDEYSNELQRQLENNIIEDTRNFGNLHNLFSIGQFVPVKVLEIKNTEKGHVLELSMKPSAVNSDLNHTIFKKEMLIWASVAEELDHGYRLEMGVPNCRVFLPTKKVPEGKKYVIGEVIWSVVHVCKVNPAATTLTVSALDNHVYSVVENEEISSLHCLIPGMQFEFEIAEVLKDGLQGRIANNFKAYVNQTQLFKPMFDLNKFREGAMVRARVLYVAPTTKFVHMTMRGLEPAPDPKLSTGKIMMVEVISNGSGGVYVKLNKEDVGFVTYKRIISGIKKVSDAANIKDLIKRRYKIGKKCKCRILEYDRMDKIYICTFEEALLKEKLFTLNDLQIGQLVEATITEIRDGGVITKIGQLQGFVPNLHLSNVAYSENIKSKFSVGQRKTARVLEIRRDRADLTFKQALVDSDICLTKFEDAQVGEQYPGVVVLCTATGALVTFYGKAKGWISRKYLMPSVDKGKFADARTLFFVGQVVSPRVTKVLKNKMYLSLLPKKEIKDEVVDVEEVQEKKKKKKRNKNKKGDGKNSVELELLEPKEEVMSEGEEEKKVKTKRKAKGGESSCSKPKRARKEVEIPTLPGINDFFEIEDKIKEESSSSDEDTKEFDNKKQKKKKLSAAERAELARLEEERIRKVEEELADSTAVPQSAEQFDRLVLANPDSSEIWTRYIAFHLSAAEIDKARATARKALETINFREIQEKLNVWIAFLNLENMLGTKETFEKIFEEAVRYSDDYKIYLEAIKMLAEMQKFEEMDEKIKKFKAKFKLETQTWIEIARVFYKIGRVKEARKIKASALNCVVDQQKQVDMLVQFAILEFNLGDQEQGEVLFETILSSYPKRTDVWTTYVDQLVKKGNVETARKVLERSICQKMSLMKMRTLFKKFKSFEEVHGTEGSVERVKTALMEYVSKVSRGKIE